MYTDFDLVWPKGIPLARLRSFWRRTSDGLNAEQLWDQFRRETRSSLNLYSAETGRNLREEWSARKGRRRVIAAVAGAMFNRLTPVRRLLFLLALALLVLPAFDYSTGSGLRITLNSTPAALILLALLVLELADRVGLKRDLEIARDIQRMLLPEKPPTLPGLDIAFATKAANTVAGDYYDAFLRPNTNDSRLLLIVADVAGKGIPAGLLMAAVQTGFHTLAADPVPLVELAARLNRSMCERSRRRPASDHCVHRGIGYLDALSHLGERRPQPAHPAQKRRRARAPGRWRTPARSFHCVPVREWVHRTPFRRCPLYLHGWCRRSPG